MKGDPQVIAALQAQLKNELTAINQYYMHYRMYKHWGFEALAKVEYKESIGEMKHADVLMDRIFMLDGLPNLQDLGKLQIGEDVPEALQCDLNLELACQATIKDGIKTGRSCARFCLSRPAAQDSGRHRRTYRLSGNPVGSDWESRRAKLPADPDGRG